MTWFLISFFILSIYPLNLINKFLNKKYVSLLAPISLFALLQLFLSTFTAFKLINFYEYKSIVISLTVVFFLFFVSLMFYIFFKNKQKFNKELLLTNFYETLPMMSCMFVSTLLLLFLETNFVDTTAYAQVSAFFQNNIYSMDGIGILDNNYTGVAQYFVYSSFGDYISLYQIFNPFLCILLMNYILLNIFDFKMKKYYLNWLLHIGISAMYLMWSYTTTGGNLIIQSSVLCILFAVVWKKEFYIIPFIFCFMNFFSSTGSLTAIVSFASLFIYFTIYYNKRLLLYLFLTTIMWAWMPFNIFINVYSLFNKKVIFYLIYAFELLMIIIPIVIFVVFRKKIFFNFIERNNYIDELSNKNYFNIGILLLTVFVIIMYPIYIFVFEDSLYFPKLMVLTYIAFGVILLALSLFIFKKKKEINKEFLFLILNSLVATIIFFIVMAIPSLSNNESIWRINYAVPWMGNVPDIVLFSLLIILFMINKYNFIFKKEKILLGIKSFLPSVMIIVSIVSYFMAFNYGSINQLSFSSNVERNVSYFTRKDTNAIKNLNVNKDTRILTSTRALTILGQGKDISNDFTQDLLEQNRNPWILNTYGFIGGIKNIYNYSSNNQKEIIKQKNITIEIIKNTINTINLDYLIVNKFEDKYVDKNTYKNVYNGDNILIFTKNASNA